MWYDIFYKNLEICKSKQINALITEVNYLRASISKLSSTIIVNANEENSRTAGFSNTFVICSNDSNKLKGNSGNSSSSYLNDTGCRNPKLSQSVKSLDAMKRESDTKICVNRNTQILMKKLSTVHETSQTTTNRAFSQDVDSSKLNAINKTSPYRLISGKKNTITVRSAAELPQSEVNSTKKSSSKQFVKSEPRLALSPVRNQSRPFNVKQKSQTINSKSAKPIIGGDISSSFNLTIDNSRHNLDDEKHKESVCIDEKPKRSFAEKVKSIQSHFEALSKQIKDHELETKEFKRMINVILDRAIIK